MADEVRLIETPVAISDRRISEPLNRPKPAEKTNMQAMNKWPESRSRPAPSKPMMASAPPWRISRSSCSFLPRRWIATLLTINPVKITLVDDIGAAGRLHMLHDQHR